jgi:hypothetical protein
MRRIMIGHVWDSEEALSQPVKQLGEEPADQQVSQHAQLRRVDWGKGGGVTTCPTWRRYQATSKAAAGEASIAAGTS